MMQTALRIHAQEEWCLDSFRLYIEDVTRLRERGSIRRVITNMVVTEMDGEIAFPAETDSFIIRREQAIELMTVLWGYGIRPANYKDSGPGEVAAMKEHIADLRQVQKAFLEHKPLLTAGPVKWEEVIKK